MTRFYIWKYIFVIVSKLCQIRDKHCPRNRFCQQPTKATFDGFVKSDRGTVSFVAPCRQFVTQAMAQAICYSEQGGTTTATLSNKGSHHLVQTLIQCVIVKSLLPGFLELKWVLKPRIIDPFVLSPLNCHGGNATPCDPGLQWKEPSIIVKKALLLCLCRSVVDKHQQGI